MTAWLFGFTVQVPDGMLVKRVGMGTIEDVV